MNKKIEMLVVTPGYPSKKNASYSFVGQLCEEFARQGKSVTVVCPQSVLSLIKHKHAFRHVHCVGDGNGLVDVYRPYYITIPYRYKRINNFLFRLCLSRFLKKSKKRFDVYYCHFWQAGYNTYSCIKRTGAPLFVATGESEISKMYETRYDDSSFCHYLSGAISVSTKNKEESIGLGLTTSEKCIVLPNAVNVNLFNKRDQLVCRNRLGFPKDVFVVAFVGWFIERKGPQRVAAAIEEIGNVKSIFIGKGEQEPRCDGILFKGPLPHDEIPLYLGAADVFVLPTQHEGCCNAVIEAMASGLPIISSNLPFNWDVLDESNSIMVDPNNVNEIAQAIRKLKEDKVLREKLSFGALKKAESLTIDNRAERILKYMDNKL